METMKSRYLECRLTFDYACIEEIEEKRQAKQKEILAKFNMTVEEYLRYVLLLSLNNPYLHFNSTLGFWTFRHA
jgi:hypothetical protein